MSQDGGPELARFVPARGKLAVMVAGLAVFTAIAGWTLWITPAEAWKAEGSDVIRVALWAVVILCPAYGLDLGLRLGRGTPTLVAREGGLVMHSILGVSTTVPWEEIEQISSVEMSRKLWLGVYLRRPVRTLERLGMVVRLTLAKSHAEGAPNFAFRAIRLGTSPEKAAEILERIRKGERRPEARVGRKRDRRARA